MKMKKYIMVALVGIYTCACNDNPVFDSSPAARMEQGLADLKQELLSAPYGWKVIYFPKTDSLLFSDPNAKVSEYDYQPKSFSYGGKYFLMKFLQNGKVEMLVDDDEKTISTSKVSDYLIGLNTMSQLSFTTYNYIHTLVNDAYEGSFEFLYAGKDQWGRMMFQTSSYLDPAKEYIYFEKLEKDPSELSYLKNSLENRRFFEKMKNPQIRISQGERVLFQSDRYLKYSTTTGSISDWEIGSRQHRYYVFLYNKTLNPVPDSYPLEVNGLGSGYVGTEDGVWFRSGIRYDKDHVFYNFYREEGKLVSELVKVYDPVSRQFFYGDSRIYPEGKFTGFRAVIEDKEIPQY